MTRFLLLWLAVILVSMMAVQDQALSQIDAPPLIEAAPGLLPSDEPEIGFLPDAPLGPHTPDPSQPPVGFLDSGVRANHPQLDGLVVAVRDFTGEGPQDDIGHGTKVTLVFVNSFFTREMKEINRVLDKAVMVPAVAMAKVVGKKLVPPQETVDRTVRGITWLADLKVKFINVSLALPAGAANYAPLCNAIEAKSDILFSIAAGNAGQGAVVYPAACEAKNKIVAGSAINGKVADYSGRADVVTEEPPAFVLPYEFYLRRGNELVTQGKSAAAREAYNSAINHSPSPEAASLIEYGLGYLSMQEKESKLALAHFEAAARAWPVNAQAYVAISVLLAERKDYDGARTWLEQGLAAGANSAPLRDRLARTLLDLDRPSDAIVQLDALKQLDPNFEGAFDLRIAAENRLNILEQVEGGMDAQVLFSALVDAGSADLVAFVKRRFAIDVNAILPGEGAPPLVRAIARHHHVLAMELLRDGADVNVSIASNRVTPLMMAANIGDEKLVKVLLEAGASIDATDYLGFTALMFAAEQGQLECARLLLARKANTRAKSAAGKTALDYARLHKHVEVATEIERTLACVGNQCR